MENNILFYIGLILINFLVIVKFDFLSKKIKLFDNPDNNRKIHKKPISLLGGSIILMNISISLTYVLIEYDKDFFKLFFYLYSVESLLVFLIIISFIFVLGFLDDKFNISPLKKFFLLIFLIFILCENDSLTIINRFSFHILNEEIYFSQLSLIFSICCYVFLIIALNMYDGINLQSSIFYLTNFILMMFYMGQLNIILISIIVGILFFSYLNFKNKAFLGDNGVFILSFLIAYIFVKLFNNTNLFKSSDIALFLFLPVIDALRVMFERQFINNKPIFYADKLHFHHKLLRRYKYKTTLSISTLFVVIPHFIFISQLNSEYFFLPFAIVYFYLIKKNNI